MLHVATQLYGTGGHTQMLSSWLRLDRAREHHVCVTGQEGRDVPDKISRVLAGPDALTLATTNAGVPSPAPSIDSDHQGGTRGQE